MLFHSKCFIKEHILQHNIKLTNFTLKSTIENRLRKLLGIPKYNSASEMLVCLNIPSFNELLRKYSYRSRLLASHNCILLSMCSSVVPLYS